MPGSIVPLPVMLEEEDQKIYDQLKAPTSMVVRYGFQKKVAELPYDGQAKPGCGSKLVVLTERGVEIAEMLTTTCPNSGCFKSVSRKDMLEYIENSGGKQFPFSTEGKVIRVATVEDMNAQAALDTTRSEKVKAFNRLSEQHELEMKLVEVEHLLENERVVFYYLAEDRVDFREMVKDLAAELGTRIEMVQVNDREEARLTADYEKCGQQCCCKNFLKVLKPVSMRSAKVQKATLDPQKISGRCGRLMCCLRYEDETYESLRKKLPHKKTRVLTDDGEGFVLNTQILTQLVLVVLDSGGKPAAYPLENIQILPPQKAGGKKKADQEASNRPHREDAKKDGRPSDRGPRKPKPQQARDGEREQNRAKQEKTHAPREDSATLNTNEPISPAQAAPQGDDSGQNGQTGNKPKRKRSRRRRPKPGQPLKANEVESKEGDNSAQVAPNAKPQNQTNTPSSQTSDQQGDKKPPHPKHHPSAAATGGEGEGIVKKKRRRRRRRGRKPGSPGTPGSGEKSGGSDGPSNSDQ